MRKCVGKPKGYLIKSGFETGKKRFSPKT